MIEDEPAFSDYHSDIESSPGTIEGNNGECILFDSSGNIKGQIHLFSEGGSSRTLSPNIKMNVEKAAKSVGRLYVKYESVKGKSLMALGTAFLVSSEILITARHCIKEKHTDVGGTEYYRTSICVDFSICSRNKSFSNGNGNVFNVELVPDNSNDLRNCDKNWKTCNDFAFLRFMNAPSNKSFAKLSIPRVENNFLAFVIGYPGKIKQDKFMEDYTSRITEQNKKVDLWEKVSDEMGYFETKVACECRAMLSTNPEQLSSHHCPTLRGTSGAPVLDELGFVIGIHVGGDYDASNNFWIPVTGAAFIKSLNNVDPSIIVHNPAQ